MESYFRWKFTILLVAMLVVLTIRVIDMELAYNAAMVDIVGCVVLLPAVLALCEDQRRRAGALGFGVPVLTLVTLSTIITPEANHLVHSLARGATALYLGFVVFAILRTLLTQATVTQDTLVGAFCGYVLVGVLFAELYCWLLLLAPEALQGGNRALPLDSAADSRWQISQYFSFATMTTVGYGDYVPTTTMARMLAMLEAILGQFYLAVLVSGLVGIRASERTSSHSRTTLAQQSTQPS